MACDAPSLAALLTPRQARAVAVYARTGSQVVAAKRLRISQPAVSQLLTAASSTLAARAGRPVSVVGLVRSGVAMGLDRGGGR